MRLIIGPTSAGKSSYIQGLTVEGAAKVLTLSSLTKNMLLPKPTTLHKANP